MIFHLTDMRMQNHRRRRDPMAEEEGLEVPFQSILWLPTDSREVVIPSTNKRTYRIFEEDLRRALQ
jgi:hypothetical protein